MEASFQDKNDALSIRITGDLIGGADAMQFSQSLREALGANAKLASVEMDVSGVEFVNSAGLGMLLSARQSATELGASFSIRNPGEQLKQLLELTKLSEILGVTSGSKNTAQA